MPDSLITPASEADAARLRGNLARLLTSVGRKAKCHCGAEVYGVYDPNSAGRIYFDLDGVNHLRCTVEARGV